MADRKTMLRLVIEMICLSPVERPARATRIRVQWQSGVVSELEVPRPARGEHRKHSIEVLNRLGELASAGHHDAKIAELLNNEKLMTGAGLEWNEDGARHARIKAGIKRVAPDRPRHHALPGQRSDGKYSIPGVMAKFGVSEGIVGRWLAKGLIHSVREDFGSHRNVHWIEIGETEASELAHRAGGRRLMGK